MHCVHRIVNMRIWVNTHEGRRLRRCRYHWGNWTDEVSRENKNAGMFSASVMWGLCWTQGRILCPPMLRR